MINDILDLSKIEVGKMGLELGEFRLPSFLKVITEIIRIRAEERGIDFKYEPLSALPEWVWADERRLRQVLLNLLSNAVKFTERGSVTFKVGYHHRKIRFHVEDTGIGIPPDQTREIFRPFCQLPVG